MELSMKKNQREDEGEMQRAKGGKRCRELESKGRGGGGG
jgi:hypothetical protein